MSDLISRKAAIDALKDMYKAAEKWGEEATDDVIKARAESCMASLIEMKLRIEQLPPAQPKHGRWIDRDVLDTDEAAEVVDEWQVAKCSVCGVHFTAPYLYHFDDYNYCPNCGAKMDEVSE